MAEAAVNLENTKFEGVTIPAGFAPTRIEGESTVEEGLVITDSEGNEFVWIPVENNMKYEMNKDYKSESIFDYLIADENYLPDGINAEGLSNVELEEKLIRDAEGFYIGRYEAGAEEAVLIKNSGGTNYWSDNPKLVCKKGAEVYCCISQTDAKLKSKTFINNNHVKSGLITGIQWDMVMNFIDKKTDGNGNIYDVRNPIESRHILTLLKCGQNNADKVCNIYDLEGNYIEWAAQRCTFSSSAPVIFRGSASSWKANGEFVAKGASNCNIYEDKAVNWFSFRFVLYVI